MPEDEEPRYLDPQKEDIVYGDRRISRPDVQLPDWEMPDTAYRPIPIVWFTGALMLELVVLYIGFYVVHFLNGWIAIGLSAAATATIAKWTWDRGMKEAGTAWKTATFLMLIFWFLMICLAASSRL